MEAFVSRAKALLEDWCAPNPAPFPVVRGDTARIEVKGEILSSCDPGKLTRLVLLAHRYRLSAQVMGTDRAGVFIIMLQSRTFAPGTPDHHPGLSDLIAQSYSMAGAVPPEVSIITGLLPLAEQALMEIDPKDCEAELKLCSKAHKFIESHQKGNSNNA